METTIKPTENQKRALELVKELADQGHITAPQAFILIMGIYENEKETVYIPYQNPYSEPQPWTINPYDPFTQTYETPWWERNKIMCGVENNINTDSLKGPIVSYATGFNWGPNDWITNILT